MGVDGADGAAIALASAGLWCVALWLAAGLFAAVLAAVPGSCGRVARALARGLLPTAVYRLVAGAAGLGVLLAPVAAGASAAGGGHTAAFTSTPPIPTPTWPTDPRLPTPAWPSGTSTTTPSVNAPRPDARPPHSARPAQGGTVVVRPGDSLWSIAAARLGSDGTAAQTAAAWPRWYAANRAVIGADPALIKPDQRLAPPASTGGLR